MLHEAFDIPGTDISILVMPVLNRFTDPEFGTVGEVLECFRQIFEVGISHFGVLASLKIINPDLSGAGILAWMSYSSSVRLCDPIYGKCD